MKMSPDQIQAVASMLTDDPDILVNEEVVHEWFGKGPQLSPLQQKLAAATGLKDATQLQRLEQEYQQFVQYRKSLLAQGEEAAVKAFVHYKKTGEMPTRPGIPQNMDELGGSDFRPGTRDRVVGPGNLRPGR